MEFMLKLIVFTPEQIADTWRVEVEYIIDLIASGELPCFKLRGKYLVRGLELSQFIERRIAATDMNSITVEMKKTLDALRSGKSDGS